MVTLSIFLLDCLRPAVRTQRVFSWGLAQDFVWFNADIGLVTPQYHRVHHSIEPAHQDKNFASMFTVWDRIFGTLHRNYDEYPATGVAGLEFAPPRRVAPAEWVRDFVRMFLHSFRALREPDTRKVTATAVAFRPEGKEQPDTTR